MVDQVYWIEKCANTCFHRLRIKIGTIFIDKKTNYGKAKLPIKIELFAWFSDQQSNSSVQISSLLHM